jgi:arylsulfatase A-like enzyme
MLTGLYPNQISSLSNKKKWTKEHIEEYSIAKKMTNAGYESVYAGKWHPLKQQHGKAKSVGYTVLEGGAHSELTENALNYFNQKHDKPFYFTASYLQPHAICWWGDSHYSYAKNVSKNEKQGYWPEGEDPWDKTMQEAEGMIFPAPPEDMDIKKFIAEKCPPLPDNYAIPENEPKSIGEKKRNSARNMFDFYGKGNRTKDLTKDEIWRLYRWSYFWLIEQVDKEIGKLLDGLEKAGLKDNTLIVFCADHGEQQGAHQLRLKQSLYDESSNVPFVVSGPGVLKSKVSNNILNTAADFYASLCDYASIPVPELVKKNGANSFRSIVETGKSDKWRAFTKIHCNAGEGVRTQNFKYNKYGEEEQLIDMFNDPGEMKNLIENPVKNHLGLGFATFQPILSQF